MAINIRQIIRSGINTINPDIQIIIQQSDGFTVEDDGTQTPAYLDAEEYTAQVQPVSSEELKHLDTYNASSIYYSIYIDGVVHGLNRSIAKGGDLVYFDGFEWLILSLPETYTLSSNWTRFMVIQQKLSDPPAVA